MDILLVHGAFHDEHCWTTFRPYLEANDFTVHSLTLRGHGARKLNPFRVSMASYARDVCERAEQIGKPCTLLGHSMGGLVVTGAAECRPDLFSQIIYLAAFAPSKTKRSMHALQSLARNTPMNSVVTVSLLGGTVSIDDESARKLFYHTCDTETATRVLEHLCPQPLRPSFSRVDWSDARLGSIPKFYIECTQDRAIPIAGQRAMQQHMIFNKVATLSSDHSPFLSMPQQLAGTIAELLH